MTGSARSWKLLALQQKARMAAELAAVADLARARAAAEGAVATLRAALAERAAPQGAVVLAGDLRGARLFSGQIAAEVDRQKARATALAEELATAQLRLARQDHRLSTLNDRARDAKRAEAAERQTRAEAASPPRQKK